VPARPLPTLGFVEGRPGETSGYFLGCVLDELATWARENGVDESELRERLEEAIDRAGES
jgi:hypothetical protein